jgi:PHD/YefM family antitoxin component YafN of YafNO toxin-antitoxin module
MAVMEPFRVDSSAEARESLGKTMSRFREDANARPVIFGAQRKPEAVILPFAQYEHMLALIEDLELARTIRARVATDGESDFNELLDDLGLGEHRA